MGVHCGNWRPLLHTMSQCDDEEDLLHGLQKQLRLN